MSAKTLKRLLLLPWRFSMGNRLTDGEKVVVSAFLVVLAGCAPDCSSSVAPFWI